jgi:hypothetical protein
MKMTRILVVVFITLFQTLPVFADGSFMDRVSTFGRFA